MYVHATSEVDLTLVNTTILDGFYTMHTHTHPGGGGVQVKEAAGGDAQISHIDSDLFGQFCQLQMDVSGQL